MMVIFKCVVPIFCAHVWIFHELDFKLCLHLAGIEVLSSVSTEKNSHGSQAVNDCFSTGSSKQKKHSGVAGSILLLPVAISFCPIGALQLMHWRATHPRILEDSSNLRSAVPFTPYASFIPSSLHHFDATRSTECSAIKSDRVLLNRGQTWNKHDCFAQSSGTERSHWPETAVFIAGPSVFASLSSPEQYSVYRRNPDKQLSLWIRNLCFLTHLLGRFCVDFLALNSCLFRSCIGSYFTSILA